MGFLTPNDLALLSDFTCIIHQRVLHIFGVQYSIYLSLEWFIAMFEENRFNGLQAIVVLILHFGDFSYFDLKKICQSKSLEPFSRLSLHTSSLKSI